MLPIISKMEPFHASEERTFLQQIVFVCKDAISKGQSLVLDMDIPKGNFFDLMAQIASSCGIYHMQTSFTIHYPNVFLQGLRKMQEHYDTNSVEQRCLIGLENMLAWQINEKRKNLCFVYGSFSPYLSTAFLEHFRKFVLEHSNKTNQDVSRYRQLTMSSSVGKRPPRHPSNHVQKTVDCMKPLPDPDCYIVLDDNEPPLKRNKI